MDLLERSYRTARGYLNIAEGGGPGRPIVLLHGVTLDWHSLDDIIAALGRTGHLYACDLPGHGRSAWLDCDYLISDYVDEVSSFVGDLTGGGTVLVGFSLGALVALGVAARLPDLVIGVAAIEPPLLARDVGFDAMRYSDAYGWIRWVDDVISGRLARSEAVARFVAMNPGSSEDDARQAMEEVAVVDPRVTARIVGDQTFEGLSLEKVLRAISCPVLLLAGHVRLGSLVRDEDIECVEANTTRSHIRRIEGGGHAIIWDEPGEEVVERLLDWVPALT
jgi:pimeloyl-ACP methyl ester carboxylesterase